LEDQIRMAQQEVRILDASLESNEICMREEQQKELQIQEKRGRLGKELEEEKLKQRHAAVEIDAQMWATRSDMLSTATSMTGSPARSPIPMFR